MSIKIINSRKRLIKSFLIEMVIFIFLVIFNNEILYKLNFILFSINTWIIFSYILGRYHDFKKISRERIIKNFFKTSLISFLIPNIYFILDKLFNLNIYYDFIGKSLFLFFFLFGLSCNLINLLINSISNRNLKNMKWIILSSNNIIDLLKKDDIESRKFLLSKFRFIENINNINLNNLSNIEAIIVQKNIELNNEEEKKLLIIKEMEIPVLSNLEWCEIFLQRIPPKIIEEELHRKKILYPKFNIIDYRIKKISEFFLSLLLIIIFSPIMLLAGILIYLEDKGSIFYSQIRSGIYGKKIKIYKLRTMKINAEEDGIQWSSKNDKRITKIGYILRKTRIDEIPQLISVLSGEMSLIGPRPERPEIDDELIKNIPGYKNRYNILPGISGWAQVNYPYGSSIKDSFNKLSYDFYYLRNFSIFLDLVILFKTIRVVLKDKHAAPSI